MIRDIWILILVQLVVHLNIIPGTQWGSGWVRIDTQYPTTARTTGWAGHHEVLWIVVEFVAVVAIEKKVRKERERKSYAEGGFLPMRKKRKKETSFYFFMKF
jgi:uncharacterized membrane protein